MMAPNESSIVRWTARMFGDDAAERVFAPLVADWERELSTANSSRALGSAWVRGAAALTRCVVVVGTRAAMPRAEDTAPLLTGAAVGTGFLLLGIVVLLVPFLPWWLNRGAVFGRLVLDLLPTILGFALPFALLPGAMVVSHRARVPASWRARVAVTVAGVAVSGLLASLHGYIVPQVSRGFQQRLRGTLPTTSDAINDPTIRFVGLAALGGQSRWPTLELRRRTTITLVWPPTLLFLGWRLGRHRERLGAMALAGWWLLPVLTAVAFQPVRAPFASLHPMGWLQTPEFSAAALWFAMALALRPVRGAV